MSSSNLYTMGGMLKVEAQSVTSEATDREIEFALDHNPDTYWAPTATDNQSIVFDLQHESEEISDSDDRDFTATAPNWEIHTMNSMSAFGDLSLTAGASGDFVVLNLATGGKHAKFLTGHTYRLTYDYTETTTGFEFGVAKTNGTLAQLLGDAVAGTGQTIEFTVNRSAEALMIRSKTSNAQGDFDNFSIQDIGDAHEIDAYGVMVYNTEDILASTTTPTLYIDYSDDGTIFTSWDNNTLADAFDNKRFGKLLVIDNTSDGQAHRFWRFRLEGNISIMKVAQFFLLKKHAVTSPAEFPRRAPQRFFNKQRVGHRGHLSVSLGNQEPVESLVRRWRIFTQADFDLLEAAYNQSFGDGLPMIITEGTDGWLAFCTTPTFDPIFIDVNAWEINLSFSELPRIKEGESY